MVCQLASARTRPNASTLAGAKLCARATAARITSCTVPCLELVGELSLPVAGRFPGRTSWMSSCRPTRMRSVVTGGGGPAGAMGCECARHHRSESTFGMHRHPSSLSFSMTRKVRGMIMAYPDATCVARFSSMFRPVSTELLRNLKVLDRNPRLSGLSRAYTVGRTPVDSATGASRKRGAAGERSTRTAGSTTWMDSLSGAEMGERTPSAPGASLPREHAGSHRLASSHVRQSVSSTEGSVSSPSSETRARPVPTPH
mmetsp:Transcript_421/g.1971  ORF Transcript_421/g.1971 Transcript_421/m.1971 type:complete len:257 (-) Transcript_421:102-872(-)